MGITWDDILAQKDKYIGNPFQAVKNGCRYQATIADIVQRAKTIMVKVRGLIIIPEDSHRKIPNRPFFISYNLKPTLLSFGSIIIGDYDKGKYTFCLKK